jgi:hypothetical protein
MGIIIPEWPSIGKSIGGLRYFQTNPYIYIVSVMLPVFSKEAKKTLFYIIFMVHGLIRSGVEHCYMLLMLG